MGGVGGGEKHGQTTLYENIFQLKKKKKQVRWKAIEKDTQYGSLVTTYMYMYTDTHGVWGVQAIFFESCCSLKATQLNILGEDTKESQPLNSDLPENRLLENLA